MYYFLLFVVLLTSINLSYASAVSSNAHVSASKDTLTLKKQDNGKTIIVKRGDIIQIELERFGGTGYEWYLDDTYKMNFDLVKEEKEEIAQNGFVGTPVVKKWQLKAIKQGDVTVTIRLYRDWEGRGKAASFYSVMIKIQ